jgi:hypothetical protein
MKISTPAVTSLRSIFILAICFLGLFSRAQDSIALRKDVYLKSSIDTSNLLIEHYKSPYDTVKPLERTTCVFMQDNPYPPSRLDFPD